MDSGLENVVAAETVLSDVDGQNGRLVIRGWPVELLAASAGFEDAAHLLWDGFFSSLPDVQTLGARLGSARKMARRAPIRATAIEAQMGTRYTIDTLRKLRRRWPKRSANTTASSSRGWQITRNWWMPDSARKTPRP